MLECYQPFRKVAHRRAVEMVLRIPLKEQGLLIVVVNEEGEHMRDNMDTWSEEEVDFVPPPDVIQPEDVAIMRLMMMNW
ncbi:hypothetical protein AMTR_s00089p00151680 [Amborella trichopoda]|uniref:Uncharacterized protein n=1 Tax=Amborella trichopoda TaxID=13333 RepID=W1P2K7_AMBTC|nr:hypothetical protein AMTR_s00089p00151680 [Amborella trichopoda]